MGARLAADHFVYRRFITAM